MGDFIQNTAVKTATRKLAAPIPDVATFNSIVASVIATNPFGCASYISAGVTHAPVEKTREYYTAKIVYQDEDAKVVGNDSCRFASVTGFTSGAAALLADTALATAHAESASCQPLTKAATWSQGMVAPAREWWPPPVPPHDKVPVPPAPGSQRRCALWHHHRDRHHGTIFEDRNAGTGLHPV